jgi:hypothetical protein
MLRHTTPIGPTRICGIRGFQCSGMIEQGIQSWNTSLLMWFAISLLDVYRTNCLDHGDRTRIER